MRVIAIRPAGVAPVYNMTVKEHHNFMVEGNIILHNCDAIRYYCISRVLAKEDMESTAADNGEDEEESSEDYSSYMCGGYAGTTYIGY